MTNQIKVQATFMDEEEPGQSDATVRTRILSEEFTIYGEKLKAHCKTEGRFQNPHELSEYIKVRVTNEKNEEFAFELFDNGKSSTRETTLLRLFNQFNIIYYENALKRLTRLLNPQNISHKVAV